MTFPGTVDPAWTFQSPVLTAEQRELLMRAGQASRRVWQLYDDPVAKVLAQELQSYVDFGHRFTVNSDTKRLIDHILEKKLP